MIAKKLIEIYETELKEAEEWTNGSAYVELPQSVRLIIRRGIVDTKEKIDFLKRKNH